MEEQYLWTIVCAVFVVILVGIAVRDRIQSRKRQITKLRQRWGKVPEQEYTSEDTRSRVYFALCREPSERAVYDRRYHVE